MKKRLFLYLVCVLLATSIYYGGEVITLRADIWEPYNAEPESAKPGYMIEVVKTIFTKAGFTVDYQCKGWTWERSIEEARQGRIDGIVGAAVDDAPDFIFPEETFINQQMTFFVKKENAWRYKDITSLDNIRFGVISGYAYDDEIDSYIEKNSGKENVHTIKNANALELNIKKLEAGRIDATIEDASVFEMKAASLGMNGKFEEAGVVGEPDNITIAFSPVKETSKKYAEILSKGLKEMRASGELKKILKNTGLKNRERGMKLSKSRALLTNIQGIQFKVISIIVIVVMINLLIYAVYDYINTNNRLNQEMSTLEESIASRLSVILADPIWNMDNGSAKAILEAEMADKRVCCLTIFEGTTKRSLKHSKKMNRENRLRLRNS